MRRVVSLIIVLRNILKSQGVKTKIIRIAILNVNRNLTASPDAHNLFAKGFEKESGLIVVPPGGESRGWVRYALEKIARK